MTTDTQTNPDFYWTTSQQNLPIIRLFGEVCKTFGFPESDDTISGVRHKIWESRGLYYHYQASREKKDYADVIIVCTKEKTRDIILEILSIMREKNIMMPKSAIIILRILKEKGKGLTTSEIRNEVILANRTVNNALRDLMSAGLVVKRADLMDMRRPKYYHASVYDHLMFQ